MAHVTYKNVDRCGTSTNKASLASTVLVLLVVSSLLVIQVHSLQKFVPNGRYGRRSDLPPLDMTETEQQAQAVSMDQTIARQGMLVSDFTPLWCTPIDAKTNVFRCIERHLMDKYLKRYKTFNDAAALNSLQTRSLQDQS